MSRQRSSVTFPDAPPVQEPGTVVTDVVVPMLQSLITGAFLTGGLVLGVGAFRKTWLPWPVAGFAWLTSSGVAWLLSTWDWVLPRVEGLLNRDIDRDGYVGRPPILVNAPPPQQAEHPIDRRRRRFIRFIELAAADTSMRHLVDRQGYSRTEYEEYRDILLRVPSWARWCSALDHRQGWELVGEPDEIIARIQ